MFNIGDVIYKDESSVPYTVEEIDVIVSPVPKYKLANDDFKFWDYCIGWKKLVTPEEVLKYGVVLTDDNLYCKANAEDRSKDYKFIRIRIICYDNRIFYHKMVNGEVIELKELKL